jgi:PhoPQ-activated pathogenicity-related protein
MSKKFVLFFVALSLFFLLTIASAEQFSVFVDGKEVMLEPDSKDPPLYDYIDLVDKVFDFQASLYPVKNFTDVGAYQYNMNLTSLQWLTQSEIDLSVWKHSVSILIPWDPIPGHAIIYITSCDNADPFTTKCYTSEISRAKEIVKSTQLPVVILFNIPNQRATWPNGQVLAEDRFVARTWTVFMKEKNNRPDLILYFPMTKATIRCMDAVEDWSRGIVSTGLLKQPITRWYPVGMSKRGQVAWLTAAYMGARRTNKIFGAAPVVYDALNFAETVLAGMSSKLGGFSFALEVYDEALPYLTQPKLLNLLTRQIDVVTPWYLPGINNVDKYVISGALDEFFMTGNDKYWYHLIERKHRLLVPMANHAFISGFDWVAQGLSAHTRHLALGEPLPVLEHVIDRELGTIELCTNHKPTKAVVYRGKPNPTTPQRLDVRLLKANVPGQCDSPAIAIDANKCYSPVDFKPTDLEPVQVETNSGTKWCMYYKENSPPPGNWAISYIIASWDKNTEIGAGVYNTPVLIFPDTTPFKSCLDSSEPCPSIYY